MTGDDVRGQLRLQVREFLDRFAPTYDDPDGFNLDRWILFYGGKLNEIVPKLKNHLVNRYLMNLDDPRFVEKHDNDEFPVVRMHRPFEPILDLDATAVDVDGNVIHFVRFQADNSLESFNVMSTREKLAYYFYALEYRRRFVLAREQATGRPSASTAVNDIGDFSLKTIADYVFYLLQFSAEIDGNFPRVITKMVLLNCPSAVQFISTVASALTSKNMELKCVPRSAPDAIFKFISKENLPAIYGGSREDVKRSYEESIKIPFATVDERKRLAKPIGGDVTSKEMKIKSGSEAEIKLKVPQGGGRIQWEFSTAGGGGVQFAIYEGAAKTLESLVVPKFTSYSEERGECVCKNGGEHTVVFANTNFLASMHLNCKLGVEPSPL